MKYLLFYALIGGLLLLVGCQITEENVKQLPQVKALLEQYPNAKVEVVKYSEANVTSFISKLKSLCGSQMLIKDYTAVFIKDTSSKLLIGVWVDVPNKVVECVYKTKIQLSPGQCFTTKDCPSGQLCDDSLNRCKERSECMPIISNGNSATKADIVFVGDGYTDQASLKSDILKIVDYEANNGYKGLMAVEPFRSNKKKFNIWMVPAGNSITYVFNAYLNQQQPEEKSSLILASRCSFADYKVIISKKTYRSFAMPWQKSIWLSVGDPLGKDKGRTLLHEFGHAFGNLADEYVEEAFGSRPQLPNCAPDIQTAQKWWGNLPGTGYNQGCSYTHNNIRPTPNSIMRFQYDFNTEFYAANEQELQEVLKNYV